jgi:putative ABC transport system permease protein
LNDRRGAIVGRKLADQYGFKPGDVIQLRGTIFPGNWEFVIHGIFDGRDLKTDTSQLFFHWEYLNETLRVRSKAQSGEVGLFVVDVNNLDRVAEVGQAIDNMFKNSFAETLSETERAFQIGFVKQTEAILISIRIVSFVVIFIILAVMANTMMMTASERIPEYATLKAIGFSPGYIARLILGESLAITLVGGLVAIALTGPVSKQVANLTETLFPTLFVSVNTVALQVFSALAVGVIAAIVPMYRAANVKIVDGLRTVN